MGVAREYRKDHSQALGRDMELLRFGDAGLALLVFPTSQGRFYQWEDFGLVGALEDKIGDGYLQLWCVDSVDGESWYAKDKAPADRVRRHLDYERYLVDELIPSMPWPPVATGTSFGAFHALLLALRQPTHVQGFVALSGAYDTEHWLDGYHDEQTYYTNPLAFLPGLDDPRYLDPLRSYEHKVIATGEDDANAAESILVADLLNEKGGGVTLDIWDGWAHDWPYWSDMMRRYV
ncbi:MAG TPA: esterase [Actinomycetota bacterium]|nr:esterase [Actinomycetota bacterium]